jgi:hypothetical protein
MSGGLPKGRFGQSAGPDRSRARHEILSPFGLT